MSRSTWATVVGIALLVVAGCGSSGSVSADSEVFKGLDRNVVTEVLANPSAQRNVEDLPSSEQPSMWQGMVGAFIMCRQMLAVFETWTNTGSVPAEFPRAQVPQDPEASFEEVTMLYSYFKKAVDSGDISQLRANLTNPAGCGNWIPATPDDKSGPTIAEVVGRQQ